MKSFKMTRSDQRIKLIFIGILILAGAALYGQTIHNPLLFDDLNQLNAERIFTDYGADFSLFHVRWVSYGSFALTFKFFGELWTVFRVSNIILHISTVVAIFLFYSSLFQAMGNEGDGDQKNLKNIGLAFAGALLFSVHPTAVYAVAYLLQRSIVMATLFSILSLACLLKGLVKRRNWWYAVSGIFYILAVFSKEHSVFVIVVALALIVLIRKPSLNQLKEFWWILPLGAAIAAGLVYSYGDILGKAFDDTSLYYLEMLAKQNPEIKKYAYPLSVMNQGYLFFKYLVLWFLPYPGWMAIDIRESFPVSFFAWPESLGFVAFLAYPVIAIRLLFQGGNKGLFGFGMLFPWILFLSELTVVWVQDPFVIYRNYLWLAGLPALLPLLMERCSGRLAIALLACGVIIAAGIATNRLATFQSELAAWNDALRYNEDQRFRLGVERLYAGRGGAYVKTGNAEMALKDYKKAIDLNPLKSDSWVNRGSAYYLLQQYAAALEDYSKAIELDKGNLKAYFNRAAAYIQTGQDDLAFQDLNYLVGAAGSGTWADVYIQRGALHRKQGRTADALQDLGKAIAKEPKNLNAYINRGNLYLELNRFIDALQDFDAARSLEPGSFDAQFGRGIANFRLLRNPDALNDFNNAVTIDPSHVKVHLFRSQTYVRLNQIENALHEYEVVLRLNPNEAQAYLNRGEIYFALKNQSGAQNDLSKACGLGMQVACEKLKQIGVR